MSTVMPSGGKTIDVKKAVQLAREALCTLFNDEMRDSPRLEEVELSEDDRFWLITMSFGRVVEEEEKLGALAGVISKLPRSYKRVIVNADDGTIKAINIRSVNE